MAPENSASPQTDLYALGCVLYEMLNGTPPFNGESQQEILLKHLREQPDLSAIPLAARRVVSSLLQKNPQRRPKSATAVLMELEAPPPVTPTAKSDATQRTSPVAGYNRRTVTLAAVGVAAVIAAVIFVLVRSQGGGNKTLLADSGTATPAASPTTTGTQGALFASPTAAPTSAPVRATATPPRPSGPLVTSTDWSPSHAVWGDVINITIGYKSGASPITKVQLHETGANSDGSPINWGSIKNPNGTLSTWDSQDYLVTPWSLAANSSATYTLTLNCVQGDGLRSKLYITFIDANNNASQDNISVTFICSQTGN